MANSNSSYLLFPGETEWEIWSIVPNQPTSLHSSHPVKYPSEIENLPTGDLMFFFPVQAFTSLPLRVPTGDPSLFPDLTSTHAERLGLRPDPMAGQLTDIFPIVTSDEESTLLSVVLRNPSSESLPTKSPKAFDLSPRALQASGNTINLWRELNQWVFAIYHGGKLVYCQTTSSSGPSPDDNVTREIRIACAQLSMQGIQAKSDRAIVWSNDAATQTAALAKALSIRVDLAPRPVPTLPDTLSNLLPADVRAARRAARQRQNTILAIAALVLFYLGAIGYFGFGLWKTHSTTQKLNERTKEVAPEGASFATHLQKWDELEYGISREYYTVDILHRISKYIPKNSGLRLKVADITPTAIILQGEASQAQAITEFHLNLKKSNDLTNYKWDEASPRQSSTGWDFTFNAIIPQATP